MVFGVAPAALLTGHVLIDSLRMEDVRVALGPQAPARAGAAPPAATPEVGAAPSPPAPAPPAAGPPAAGPGRDARPSGAANSAGSVGSVRFAPTRITLARGALTWDDWVGGRSAHVAFSAMDGRAERSRADAPWRGWVTGSLDGGGVVRLEGTLAPGGALDLSAKLDEVDVAPFAPYLGKGLSLGGTADGTLALRGSTAAFDAIEATVEVAHASVHAGSITAEGPVSLRAHLAGAPAALAGTFDLDATRAELTAYGGAFRKPPGAPAKARGQLVRDASGRLGAGDVRLDIEHMNGALRLAPDGVVVDAPVLDLGALADYVPALAPLAPSGRLTLEAVRVGVQPPAFHGRVALDDVVLHPPGRPPIAVAGAIVGAGESARSDALVARLDGAEIAIQAELAGLDAAPRHHTVVKTREADAGALVAAVTGRSDAVEGPATVAVDVSGPLGPGAVDGLTGAVDVAVGAGRIPGVSPLDEALRGLARFPEFDQVVDADAAARALAPYRTDRFESIHGRFEVAGGTARTDDLELHYPGYDLALRGGVRLADQRLDLSGRVALDPAVEAALAGRPPERSDRARVIEVAHVEGTVAEPRLRIDRAGAVAFAATLALAQRRDELGRKLDRKLGHGTGEAVLDLLDGVLGRKERRR
jgi:hypothetical protein